jgi:non-specific serine/threonine protein kinase
MVTPHSRSAGQKPEAAQSGAALPVGSRLDNYEITGLVRQSAFVAVYASIDHSLHRKVFVEEYLPTALADRLSDASVVVRSLRHQHSFREGLKGFVEEARLLANLNEPALVKVFRVWEQNGTAYMVTPAYEGRSLKEVLRESGTPSEAWLKPMLGPLLDALEALHSVSHYPSDVTPDDILMLGDGAPLLFDLGTARRSLAKTAEEVTVVLKPGFVPIEQSAEDPSLEVGPWTDIYAVAAVLHFAITGKPPPSPTTRLIADNMQPLRNVVQGYSEQFLEGIDRGLAVRPEHRPQTIAEFRDALGIVRIAPIAMPMEAADVEAQPLPGPADDVSRSSDASTTMPAPPEDDAFAATLIAPSTASNVPPASDLTIPPPPRSTPRSATATPTTTITEPKRSRGPMFALVGVGALVVIAVIAWMLMPHRASSVASNERQTAKSPERVAPPQASTQASPISEPSAPPSVESSSAPAPPAPQESVSAANTPVTRESPVPSATSGVSSAPAATPNVPQSAAAAGTPQNAPAASAPVPATPPAAPAPRLGRLQLSIKPWGEVLVDGKSRGISPPLKTLSLPEGRHRIEIRNSTFRGYANEIEVKAGASVSIAYSFTSQ